MFQSYIRCENGPRILFESGQGVFLVYVSYPAIWNQSISTVKAGVSSPWSSASVAKSGYPSIFVSPSTIKLN